MLVTSHRISESLGGVERFVESFSTWCYRNGYEISVISRSLSLFSVKVNHGKFLYQKINEPFIVKKIQLPYSFYCLGMLVFSLLSFVTLLKIIKKSRCRGKDVIIHSQDLNFAAISTVFVGKILSAQTVVHQHGPYLDLLSSNYSKKIEQILITFTCKLCDKIIVTDTFTQRYVARFSGRNDIIVIPAAIDTSDFMNFTKNNSNDFIIGYVGRLSLEKNVDTLINAFKGFKQLCAGPCKLLIVGDGPLRTNLMDLVNYNDVKDYVIFTGFQREIINFLSSFDIFVLPSKVEGTPIALIEAMAAGKAIITSDIPSIRQIINDKREGLLFNPNNIRQLKDLMFFLYTHPELRLLLGKNAKEKSKMYALPVIFNKIIDCYKSTSK